MNFCRDVEKVYKNFAEWYFDHSDPINSACCHLAISDIQVIDLI
jgi:hypothetical protein